MTPTDMAAEAELDGADGVSQRLDAILDLIEGLEGRVDRLEAENEQLREDLANERSQRRQMEMLVEERLAEYDRRTSVLANESEMENWSEEDFALHAIAKLYRIARENDTRIEWATVSTAHKEWWSCIPHRTTVYDIFRRADEISGDSDVVTFIEEPRGQQPPSRLKLDLTSGPLPESVAPHVLDGCGASTTPEQGPPGDHGPKNTPTDPKNDR